MEFIFLLFLHWVGDFFFQHRWMGEGKGRNLLILLLHVLVYSVVMYVGMGVIIYTLQSYSGIPMSEFIEQYGFTGANQWDKDVFIWFFIGHFFVDIWTSKLTGLFYKKYIETNDKKWMGLFWNTIGIDQLLHGVHIYLIYIIIFAPNCL